MTAAATLLRDPANAKLNKSPNVECLDATRVILKDGPPEHDYHHANWITICGHEKGCILGQGECE